MRSNKGQALIEFVIIMPVMLMLIFCIIDFGRLIYEKNDLDNTVSDIALMYQNDISATEIKNIISKEKNKDIKINVSQEDDYTNIKVSYQIKPITPGLNFLQEKVFNLETNRVIK